VADFLRPLTQPAYIIIQTGGALTSLAYKPPNRVPAPAPGETPNQPAWPSAETQRWLATILDSSDDAIISKDLDGRIVSWNPGAERLYGYTAAEVLGKSISLLVPRDRADELPDIMERVRQGARVERFETVRQHKEGTRLNISVTISPVRDAAGQVVGTSAIARDITERKRAEAELRVANERLDLALRGSNIGVWENHMPDGDLRASRVKLIN